jgi:hypothetical protein
MSGEKDGMSRLALSVDPEWNKCHEASYLLSHHHLQRLNNEMKLPKFLSALKIHRRQRSKARSEISPTKGQSEVEPSVPRPTESTPDLRIGTSTLPMPSPLTPRNQESNGMYISTILFQTIYLRTLFA